LSDIDRILAVAVGGEEDELADDLDDRPLVTRKLCLEGATGAASRFRHASNLE